MKLAILAALILAFIGGILIGQGVGTGEIHRLKQQLAERDSITISLPDSIGRLGTGKWMRIRIVPAATK